MIISKQKTLLNSPLQRLRMSAHAYALVKPALTRQYANSVHSCNDNVPDMTLTSWVDIVLN